MPRRPIAAIGSVLLLGLSLLTTGPVLASRSHAAADGLDDPAIERSEGTRKIRARGQVEVEQVARDVRDVRDAGGRTDIAGAPATENGSASPTLTKLALRTGQSDPSVAVGPDHVIRADSTQFVISDRTGAGAQVVTAADLFLLPDGWEGSSGNISFDARQQRWIAVEASQRCDTAEGALDIAISDTADPTAGWRAYYFAYDGAKVTMPSFGNSTDKFVFTAQVQSMLIGCTPTSTEWYWDVTVLDIPQALAGTEIDAAYFVYRNEDDQDQVYDLLPVPQQPATTATAYVVAHGYLIGPEEVRPYVFQITGSGGSVAIQAWTDLRAAGLDAYAGPPSVPNLDFTPSPFPTSAAWRAGRLAFTQTQACVPTGDVTTRACQLVVELATTGSGATIRQDLLIAANGADTLHGSLAYSGSGELIISYGRTTGSGISAWVVRQAPTAALNSISAATTLEPGTGDFTDFVMIGRIGSAPDPLVADAVWTTNMASASGGHEVRAAQASTAIGATYETIAPARILDTRTAVGLSGPFQSNVPRSFQVAGVGAIPSDAVAITANVTVAGQTGAGYVSVTPVATSTPTSSTLNFPASGNRANNVTVSLDPNGKLAAVYKAASNRTTGLIVDVTGYFLADDTGSTYEPVTPVRLLDSRIGLGTSSGFVANVPKTFQITGGAIPADAVAITGNLTVTGQSRGGYVSVTPTPQANPTTSTINFPVGDTRANGLTIPLSGSGSLSAVYKTSTGSTHLILDVTGYYLEGTSGLRFYPLQPGRILDTRATTLSLLTGTFVSSTARTLPVGGHVGVPVDAEAVTGNLTVTGQSNGGYVSITRTKTNSPTVSTINFPSGDTRANGVTVPLDANQDVHLVYKSSSGARTHLILDLTGYFR